MSADRRHCVTCGDEAVVARVVAVEDAEALVEVDGRTERVATDLLVDVRPGDLLLCHAGLALDVVPEGT